MAAATQQIPPFTPIQAVYFSHTSRDAPAAIQIDKTSRVTIEFLKNSLSMERWPILLKWKTLPVLPGMYRTKELQLDNGSFAYALNIRCGSKVETHFYKTEEDRKAGQEGLCDIVEFESKIPTPPVNTPPSTYLLLDDPIEVTIYGCDKKARFYFVYTSNSNSYVAFRSIDEARDYIDSMEGWYSNAKECEGV